MYFGHSLLNITITEFIKYLIATLDNFTVKFKNKRVSYLSSQNLCSLNEL